MHRTRIVIAFAVVLTVLSTVTFAVALDGGGPTPRQHTSAAATAQGTAFTYQGRLNDAGGPANGTYDFRFILYDAESGGAQVGTITEQKDDVAVASGLFTVQLDFGATAFNGDARWLEIAVRAGSLTGTSGFVVLSPRQAISNAPYALYAQAAGGVAVPFAASGTSAGATPPATQQGLVDVEQQGTGIGISGRRTSIDAAAYPAIYGLNTGGGAGVQGESTNALGVGVSGFASSATGTAGSFVGGGAGTSVALEVGGGALKVSGTVKPAFVHTVSAVAGTRCGPGGGGNGATVLDYPLINGDATAIILVTRNGGSTVGASTAGPEGVAVAYNATGAATPCPANKWVAFIADGAAEIPAGTQLNVLVIKQ